MLRFLRRVAPAAALGRPSDPRPFSGLFLASASASPSAAGHLGLARARPGLGDVLTPEALLLDATHALGAAVLRDQPRTGQANRVFHDLIGPAELARAEASGNAKAAEVQHVLMALLDVEDGRLQDGLHALARRAVDCPAWGISSVCAAAVCDMLGRADESDRWLSGIPVVSSPREHFLYHTGVVTATLGGAPVASVAGSEGRVAAAVVHIVNDHVRDGKMSAVQIISAGMLKRAAMRACKDLELNGEDGAGIFRALVNVVTGGSVPDPQDPHVNLLNASQALLSATVLRARRLFGERVRAALRAVQRDLARAVRKREDPALVADLRLLVAFLAARDGRFDDALERYVELERADPSDPRPHYLAHLVCKFDGRREDSDKWLATYNRLATGSSVDDQGSLVTLADELVVALALGGSLLAFDDENHPAAVRKVVGAAASRVDAALVCALQDKEGMSVVDRLEVRAVRAFLHAGVWSLLKELKSKDGGNGSTTD